MQRRVEQADRDRQPGHRLEQALEVLGLQREQLGERGAAVLAVLGHDHRLHLRLAVGGHEHVLGPAQADPLGAELARLARVLGRVGVGAHAEPAVRVRPAEDAVEVGVDLGLGERDVVGGHAAGRAVDRDQVALAQDRVADAQLARLEVDPQRGGAGDARLAHPARDERGVRGLAALGGEDPLRGEEAVHVVGLGERADEHHGTAALRPVDRVVRREDDLALGGAGRGGDARGEHVEVRVRVEGGVEERVQAGGVDRGQRAALVEQPLADRVDREAHGGLRRALGVARLQHVQAPLLDGELRVLHVEVVLPRACAGSAAARRAPRASRRPSARGRAGCARRTRRPRPGR